MLSDDLSNASSGINWTAQTTLFDRQATTDFAGDRRSPLGKAEAIRGLAGVVISGKLDRTARADRCFENAQSNAGVQTQLSAGYVETN